ncbi:hypothetical protein GCM10025779_07820 [Arthrobacter cryoconiti]
MAAVFSFTGELVLEEVLALAALDDVPASGVALEVLQPVSTKAASEIAATVVLTRLFMKSRFSLVDDPEICGWLTKIALSDATTPIRPKTLPHHCLVHS